MISIQYKILVTVSFCLPATKATEIRHPDTTSLQNIANISYATENLSLGGLASIFSPRMDFEQWKPLTGRGDPLRNDPTYDYEPPVLERVHYWADDTRIEREHYPDRKSEVLMLGVSSHKPSVPSRPSPPPRRHRPPPHKYEDFAYKLNEHYPMTILVPPPLPPPGHKPQLFVLTEEKIVSSTPRIKSTETPTQHYKDITPSYEPTASYALQEANLVYQSSTTHQNWITNLKNTKPIANNVVSSDYAGWGPTTPIEDNDIVNDTHNYISNEHLELTNHPYSFYKPMLSEAPPPPRVTSNPLLLPTFFPTALPLTDTVQSTTPSVTQTTLPIEQTTFEFTTETLKDYQDTQTDKYTNSFLPTKTPLMTPKLEKNKFDMISPMLTMPLVNGPDRLEDNLYAHASENLQVFKDQQTGDAVKLDTMQTMQPPPVIKYSESTVTHKVPVHINLATNSLHQRKPVMHNHDPYLHMRFTTPAATTTQLGETSDITKSTKEPPTVPMYLIIQGHSKVKTYGSKPKPGSDKDTISNEIPKPNETTEVKHLHPIKDKYIKKQEKVDNSRKSRAKNLKSLVNNGHGSIEIQETDIGIKYDVSDGSEVPLELYEYRKGIVDNDENNYSRPIKSNEKLRVKRQIDLEDLIPFDEDTLEEYVYNYFKSKRNSTGITGIIAQAVTSNGAANAAIDALESDEEDDEHEDR